MSKPQESAVCNIETKTLPQICADYYKQGANIQYNSALITDLSARFRKVDNAVRGELIKELSKYLTLTVERLNVTRNMDAGQCVDCVTLIAETFPDMSLADFFSFLVSFRSLRFRGSRLPYTELFGHIDEQVIILRIEVYNEVRDRVLQTERNAAENQKSLKAGPRVTGVWQVEDAPEKETPVVHISETLKALGFLAENTNQENDTEN